MSIVISILAALIVLGILVTVHEGGHFLMGKWLGFKILEFSIGMGPKLFSKEKNGTIYSLRAFPIGGMCAFEGEDEASDKEGSFNTFPAWKRFLVAFAGPFMNIILAFVFAIILMLIFGQYKTIDLKNPQIASFANDSPAYASGLQIGDIVKGVNGKPVTSTDELINAIRSDEDGDIELTILRPTQNAYYTINGKEFAPVFSVNEVTDIALSDATTSSDAAITDYSTPSSDSALSDDTAMSDSNSLIGELPMSSDLSLSENIFNNDILPSDDTEQSEVVLFTYELNSNTDASAFAKENSSKNYDVNLSDYEEMTITIKNTYNEESKCNMIGATITQSVGGYTERYNVLTAVPAGSRFVVNVMDQMYQFLGSLFKGGVSAKDVSGIVGVVDVVNDGVGTVMDASEYKTGQKISIILEFVMYLAVLLSINLGIINLLPLPALDGGRILFNIIEMIVRKPVPAKVEGTIHTIGLILLLALIAVITIKDIVFLFI